MKKIEETLMKSEHKVKAYVCYVSSLYVRSKKTECVCSRLYDGEVCIDEKLGFYYRCDQPSAVFEHLGVVMKKCEGLDLLTIRSMKPHVAINLRAAVNGDLNEMYSDKAKDFIERAKEMEVIVEGINCYSANKIDYEVEKLVKEAEVKIPSESEFFDYCVSKNWTEDGLKEELYGILCDRGWKTRKGKFANDWRILAGAYNSTLRDGKDAKYGKVVRKLAKNVEARKEEEKKEAMGERRQTKGDEYRIVAKPTYEEFAMYCSMAGFTKDNLKWLYGRFDDVGWLLPSGKVPKKWEDLVKKWNSLKNPSQTYRKHGFKFKTKEEKMHDCYEVWTDGSAVLRTDTKRRKYTGGAAYVILHDGKVYKQGNYGTVDTTISRMELLAIICGVGHCPQGAVVTVYSDSQYALNTLSGVYSAHKNLDLMEKFRKHSAHVAHITWRKVKSHSGVEYNELCDRLANEGRIDAEIKAGLRVTE